MRIISLTVLALALAACGEKENDPTGTTTVDYNKLNTSTPTESPLALANQDELSRHIKNGLRLQLKNGLMYKTAGSSLEDNGVDTSAPSSSGQAAGGETGPTADDGSSGFSDTNVHVLGVDEADYAKYDGKHWFVATSSNYQDFVIENKKPGFQIVATDPASPNIDVISHVELDGDSDQWGQVSEMYLVQENDNTTHIATIRNQWGNIGPYLPGIAFMGGDVGVSFPSTSGSVSIDIAVEPESPDTLEPTSTAALRIALPTDSFPYPNPQNSRVTIQLTDVQSPESPKQDWQVILDGSLIDSRKVGNMLYLLTRFDPWVGGLYFDNQNTSIREQNETALTAISTEQLLPNYETGGVKQPLSESCYLQQGADEYKGYSSLVNITAIDLSKKKLVSSKCINEGLEALSMSQNALYLTGTVYSPNDSAQKTVIHKFNLGESGPEYVATGSVKGSLGWNSDINFRMHEHDGTFRIVTSDWAEEGPEHMLTILKEQGTSLSTLSTLPNKDHPEPIGKPREEIYSVRFEKNRAYIVTFRRTDPLYAIDLSDPLNPFVAGELEIPGFATYMHPVGEGYLFTLGRDADENGRTQGMKAELIDVSGDTPQVINTLLFGGSATNSDALADLKALSFKQDDDRLRITLPIIKYSENNNWEYSGLQLLEVNGLQQDSANRLAAPAGPRLTDVGTLISDMPSNDQTYPSRYGINRSVIHDNAVFYAHNNAFWAAQWDDPKAAIGPVTEAPAQCTDQVEPPALIVNLNLEGGDGGDPCGARVIAYNNQNRENYTLTPSLTTDSNGSCQYTGHGPVGEYSIVAELPGYQYQKGWAVVYRDQCHVITKELDLILRSDDLIVCTTEARPSLVVYVDIDPQEGAFACDASVIAIQNGVQYQLDGHPFEENSSGSFGGGSTGSAGTPDSNGNADVTWEAQLLAAPVPPEPSTRCEFSGPYEIAGEMSVEVNMDGYAPEVIENIFVERDACHVQTVYSKVWLGLQPE